MHRESYVCACIVHPLFLSLLRICFCCGYLVVLSCPRTHWTANVTCAFPDKASATRKNNGLRFKRESKLQAPSGQQVAGATTGRPSG
mmetsp:Transcript_15595/g.26856  ORF Transcript_15595/g.26856 Transcript_15595/m.26856 type:complete len:87 (+) Transcript_15595:2267-2527(+)